MLKQVDSSTREVIGLFLELYAKFRGDVGLDHETSSVDGFHP